MLALKAKGPRRDVGGPIEVAARHGRATDATRQPDGARRYDGRSAEVLTTPGAAAVNFSDFMRIDFMRSWMLLPTFAQ